MNSTRPGADPASVRRATPGVLQPSAVAPMAAQREIAMLESAHEQLMRQVQDLRRAYEAERRRRARLEESTYGLVSVLTGAAATTAYAARDDRESNAVGGA